MLDLGEFVNLQNRNFCVDMSKCRTCYNRFDFNLKFRMHSRFGDILRLAL